jgi:hypothetical protein
MFLNSKNGILLWCPFGEIYLGMGVELHDHQHFTCYRTRRRGCRRGVSRFKSIEWGKVNGVIDMKMKMEVENACVYNLLIFKTNSNNKDF